MTTQLSPYRTEFAVQRLGSTSNYPDPNGPVGPPGEEPLEEGGSANTPQQVEAPVYAAGQLGTYYRGSTGTVAYKIQYAITDHLGNVRVVIRGEKNASGEADVLGYTDYYPFGWEMPGRQMSGDNRYAYQGIEKDPETGWTSFQLRMYDSRIGRWAAPDPMGQYYSPYLAMGNDPVNMVDPNGGFAVTFDPVQFAMGVASFGAGVALGNATRGEIKQEAFINGTHAGTDYYPGPINPTWFGVGGSYNLSSSDIDFNVPLGISIELWSDGIWQPGYHHQGTIPFTIKVDEDNLDNSIVDLSGGGGVKGEDGVFYPTVQDIEIGGLDTGDPYIDMKIGVEYVGYDQEVTEGFEGTVTLNGGRISVGVGGSYSVKTKIPGVARRRLMKIRIYTNRDRYNRVVLTRLRGADNPLQNLSPSTAHQIDGSIYRLNVGSPLWHGVLLPQFKPGLSGSTILGSTIDE